MWLKCSPRFSPLRMMWTGITCVSQKNFYLQVLTVTRIKYLTLIIILQTYDMFNSYSFFVLMYILPLAFKSIHILYMGIENGINAMENNLAVSLRVKNRFALCPNDFTSRYLSTQGKLKHMFTQNSTFEYSQQQYFNSEKKKQSKCSLTGERISKIRYINTMEYYLANN